MQSYQSKQKGKGICRHVERQRSFNNHLLRIIVPAMLLVLAFSAPAIAWLQVSSPAGGEVWNKGQTYTIQWEDTGCIGNINLCKGREAFDECSYKTFVASGISGNSYQYTVSLSEFADEFKFEIWVDCSGRRIYGYSGYFQVPAGTPPDPDPEPEPQRTGSIRVVLSPDEAINEGARWQVDSGAWYNSGDVLSNLSEGFHQLAFSQISGWNAPAPNPMSVYVTPSMTTTRTPDPYTKQATPPPSTEYGNLQVIINYQAVNADAQWQVDGGAWQASGTTLSLPVGNHTITFKQISGWITPSSKTLYISKVVNTQWKGDYTLQSTPSPTFVSGNASQTVCIGGQATFECVWNAPIGHSIEGVKARYRIVGTSGWSNEVFLGYVKNTDSVKNSPQFSGAASISSEGEYEFQFQATDMSTSPASVSQWMPGSGRITVQGECPPNTCVKYPLDKVDTTNATVREVIPKFSFGGHYFDHEVYGTGADAITLIGYHPGTDFYYVDKSSPILTQSEANFSKPVRAIADGYVRKISKGGWGTLMAIEHTGSFFIPGKADPVKTIYAVYFHLGSTLFQETQDGNDKPPQVKQGDIIGTIGNWVHLHLEIRLSTAIPSTDWSLVYPQSNWTGTYYKTVEGMIAAGLVDPVAFLDANSCNAPQPQSTTLFKSSSTIATSGTDRKAVAITSASIGTNSFSLYFPSTYTRKKGLRESPSELDLIITTPSGNVITPDSPEVKDYVSETNKKSYTIDVQEVGEWIAEIVAVRVPPEGESYSFEVIKLDGIIDPAIDTDNDGIPDIWEYEHGLNPLINDASTDSDNDGVSNLDEYKAGTDPNDPNSKPDPPACACITDGLVACYKFDGNANDGSGNGNDGIAQGSVSYVAGVKGSAVKFGGISSPGDILVKNSASIQFNQGLTISSFVKISDPIGMDGYNKKVANGDHTLVAKSHDRKGLYMRASVNASSLFDTRGGNDVYTSKPFYFGNATTADKKDKWVHIAYVIGNGVSKIFLDGVLITPSTGTVDFSIANQQDLYIGKYSDYWYPSGAAMDDLLIYNRALSDAEIKELYAGSCNPEPPTPPVTPGTFTVDNTGMVKIDWLYDGGRYQGEFGIFNLAGMENLTPGSPEFIAEAVKRVLSSSDQGYLVFSDLQEGARFSGILGNEIKDWNAGQYKGLKNFAMAPGTQFATILVPNSTFQSLSQNPGTEDTNKRPLFSLVSQNPAYGMYLGQMADINGMGKAYSYEDKDAATSDWDFNDLIVQITGAESSLPTLDSLVGRTETRSKRDKRDNSFTDWRTDSELGQMIMAHIEAPAPTSDTVSMTVTLNTADTLLVYDPKDNVIGKDGGYVAGATFELKADGTQTVTFPNLNPGSYRVSVQGASAAQGTLTVKTSKGGAELSSNQLAVNIAPHQILTATISADTEPPAVAPLNAVASYDFNADSVVDNTDVEMLVKHWNSCRGQQKYDAFFDVNDDGCITVADIMTVLNAKTVK